MFRTLGVMPAKKGWMGIDWTELLVRVPEVGLARKMRASSMSHFVKQRPTA